MFLLNYQNPFANTTKRAWLGATRREHYQKRGGNSGTGKFILPANAKSFY